MSCSFGTAMDDCPKAAAVRLWREGKADLESMVSAARLSWWVWDAVNEIAPDRLSFPRPKRPRGRDAEVNMVRDIRIAGEVELLRRGFGWSLRKACADFAGKHPELNLTAGAVEAVHRKERGGNRT